MFRLFFMFVLVSLSGAAQAQISTTGDAALKSQYVFGDLFVPNDEPVVQAFVDFNWKCLTVEPWVNVGATTSVGNEFDMTATCKVPLAKGVTLTPKVARFIFIGKGGGASITELSAKLTAGAFDIALIHYTWDGNMPNGKRVELGYNTKLAGFDIRASALAETGLGVTDLVAGRLDVSVPINKRFTLTASGFVPIAKKSSDRRKARAVLALGYSF